MSYIYETSLYPKAAMASSTDMNLQFLSVDSLSPLNNSTFDSFIQTISDPLDNSYQLQNIRINQSQPTHLNSLTDGYNPELCYTQNAFVPQNATKFMQRSYSSDASGICFKPYTNMEIESPKFHNLNISSPEEIFFIERMRKVSSTGDLQNTKSNHANRSLSSSSASDWFSAEESSFKVGRYSAEEKKEKIQKYRAKRSQRNFNKTIKYACRKTLADTRPRIRGRFARNDEVDEILKAACSGSTSRDEDEYEIWLNELHGQEADGTGSGHFVNSYGIGQYQQYGY